MMLSCSPRHDTCQDHQIGHFWHDGIFLDFYENISCRNISNPWNGQKWFWGDFMGLYYSPWHDTCQDHQTCHMWHARIFLECLENISFVNILKAWNIQKGFLRDLTNILNMTMCWNSYIWEIYAPWVSLIVVKHFWTNKIIFPY